MRIFYAFDPKRDAVLLIGGDKTGAGRFYERMAPTAERIWEQYLEESFGRGGRR
ncbi:MAG: type II toxin-antitoxin system RelE/ParE family toxin [Myxococcales bacterium]